MKKRRIIEGIVDDSPYKRRKKELMNGIHVKKKMKHYFAFLIWRSITSAMHSLACTLDSSIRCA